MTIASALRLRTLLFLLICSWVGASSMAEEVSDKPQWIWTSLHNPGSMPSGACHFRHTFQVTDCARATLEVAADDSFQIFVNGQEIGRGTGWKYLKKYDVSQQVQPGRNAIAIKVVNAHTGHAGLAARMLVESNDGTLHAIATGRNWKASISAVKFWQRTNFADGRWRNAKVLGAYGTTQPWIAKPLPTAERIAAINSPTKPKRALHPDLPELGLKLASAEEPEVAPAPSSNKPRTKLIRPLRPALPWFNGDRPKPPSAAGGLLGPLFGSEKQDQNEPELDKPDVLEIVNQHTLKHYGALGPSRHGPKKKTSAETRKTVPPRVDETNRQPAPQPFGPAERRTKQMGAPQEDKPRPTKSLVEEQPAAESKKREAAAGTNRAVDTPDADRFKPPTGFRVDTVISAQETGSVISATFNEFGQLLIGQEKGPLRIVVDSDGDEKLDSVRTYCDSVKNCQGILALSGMVFVLADGPEGNALYRLNDANRDGELEEVTPLVQFKVASVEHGPHGIVLGPDGYLYVAVGNHATLKGEFDPLSPQRELYEGDLIPRYEDPGGHAQGIKVPGGFILRTDVSGSTAQLFASGLRNAYDLAFNADGQLFTHDSDMESDRGTTWYRPTRLYHVLPGSEFGWRSGWSKWPSYYQDVVPPLLETGRGSPTGMVFYQHHAYPPEYDGVAFLGDWSQGRILTARLSEDGAGYTAEVSTFLEGKPLNVTDLDVGPDGSLYFVTGGRSTQGGVYRVVSEQSSTRDLDLTGIQRATWAPQLQSSWGRQRVAAVQRDMGRTWDSELAAATKNPTLTSARRIQALQTMQWIGPIPDSDFLLELSQDADYKVRRAAAALMTDPSDNAVPLRLVELLDDRTSVVRRQAAESLVRANRAVPFDYVEPLLRSDQLEEVWAGRRLLALDKPAEWQQLALDSDDIKVFIGAATTLMTAWPAKARAIEVVKRAEDFMMEYVNDDDFIQLLRTIQLAVLRGELKSEDVGTLTKNLSEEFPAAHDIINRELIRLLTRLQVTSIKERYLAHLRSDLKESERIHLAVHLATLKADWTTSEKLELSDHLRARAGVGGGVSQYLQNVAVEFGRQFNADETEMALRASQASPVAALAAVLRLPESLSVPQIRQLIELDRSSTADDPDTKKLKVAILAMLARDGQDQSMAYLRHVYDRDPSRRQAALIGLAEHPEGANWSYLVKGLRTMDAAVAKDVIVRLRSVDRSPDESGAYRQVIVTGLRLGKNGGNEAVKLLEHWQGFAPSADTPPWDKALAAWQNWFSKTYPNEPVPTATAGVPASEWNYESLLGHLTDDNIASASPGRGKLLFAETQCAKCHRHGNIGEAMGPDLSSIGKRFSTKEILDSILYPSRTISDQYRSKTLITDDGRALTGIVGSGGEGVLVVLSASGEKTRVPTDEVEQTLPSKTSAMPEGLINGLTDQQVADLFAYLRTPHAETVARQQNP